MKNLMMTLLGLMIISSTASALGSHSLAGNYSLGEQKSVYITKVSDRKNLYFVNIFNVESKTKSCLFEDFMKEESGKLVMNKPDCQIVITKDSPKSVRTIGECKSSCKDGGSIEMKHVRQIGNSEAQKYEFFFLGD